MRQNSSLHGGLALVSDDAECMSYTYSAPLFDWRIHLDQNTA
jgi:hypothetical protein